MATQGCLRLSDENGWGLRTGLLWTREAAQAAERPVYSMILIYTGRGDGVMALKLKLELGTFRPAGSG